MSVAFWSYPLPQAAGTLTVAASDLAKEVHVIHGLDPAAPLTVTTAQRNAGGIVQTITSNGDTTTLERQWP